QSFGSFTSWRSSCFDSSARRSRCWLLGVHHRSARPPRFILLRPELVRTPRGSRITTMTLKETLKQLKALGNESVRKQNAKWGAADNQFGVKHGDIRVLAKKIKTDHKLAMSLWKTGN